MTERERLIKLIRLIPYEYLHGDICPLDIADFLLDNGVIVPHVKINQHIWIVSFSDRDFCEGCVTSIKTIGYNHSIYYCDFYNFDGIPLPSPFSFDDNDIGKTVFFTKEEAKKALAERSDKE